MKLLTAPESSSYAVEFADQVVRTKLDGGASRYRQDILNGSNMVDCQWVLDQAEYDYFMAFYRNVAKFGSIPFEMDLIIEDHNMGERSCHFNGPPKLSGQQGLAQIVTAQLEVDSLYDDTDDAATVAAFNTAHGYTP